MLEEFQPRRKRGVPLDGFLCRHKGSSSQSTSQASTTQVSDSRVGVADKGVYANAGAKVDQSTNDNRSFDDHSQFTVQTTDSRDFSDRSTSNFWDQSVHVTSDADTVKAAADAAALASAASSAASQAAANGAFDLSRDLGKQSTQLLTRALDFGQTVVSDSFTNSNKVTEAGFGAVTGANERGIAAVSDANTRGLNSLTSTVERALDFASGLFGKSVDTVAKSAADDRAFASEFTGRIFDTAKSADQANVEKIVKAITVIVGIGAAAWALKAIFGKSKA